jgi:hypothetical protein
MASLVLSGTSFATKYTCIPTVLPSLASNQYYDFVFKRGSTFYQVPSFSTQPTEFLPNLVYRNAFALPSGVTFNPATRTYDWSGL